jgi:hypothetical protein
VPSEAPFDLPAFLEAVLPIVGQHRADLLAEMRQRFDAYVRTLEPLTQKVARDVTKMRELFDQIEGLAAGRLQPSETPQVLDPRVVWLLVMTTWHLAPGDRAAAADELRAIVKRLTQRPKGRPREIPYATLQAAKRRSDGGESPAAIGRQLGLTRGVVRTALLHYYGVSDHTAPTVRAVRR